MAYWTGDGGGGIGWEPVEALQQGPTGRLHPGNGEGKAVLPLFEPLGCPGHKAHFVDLFWPQGHAAGACGAAPPSAPLCPLFPSDMPAQHGGPSEEKREKK